MAVDTNADQSSVWVAVAPQTWAGFVPSLIEAVEDPGNLAAGA
jgi:hypothetical protein